MQPFLVGIALQLHGLHTQMARNNIIATAHLHTHNSRETSGRLSLYYNPNQVIGIHKNFMTGWGSHCPGSLNTWQYTKTLYYPVPFKQFVKLHTY